ncbi:hypothetical protein RB195_020620 [Necator americanus]|uniref:Reverse transcriptase domain-containing protein n=1 Tax=Necator americanus TaxID=51031 RepID=A0ABR1CL36_NECAM
MDKSFQRFSVRNTTCYHVEPSASTHQHPGEALYRYLSECKVPKQWKTSKTVLLYKKEIHMTSATIAQLPTVRHLQALYKTTLENAMRKFEWDDMGVNFDGRQLHHLRFADDIVLVTPSISQAERMLTEFDETCDASVFS